MEKEEIQKIFRGDIKSEVAVQANEIKHLHSDVEDMKADIEEIKKISCRDSQSIIRG